MEPRDGHNKLRAHPHISIRGSIRWLVIRSVRHFFKFSEVNLGGIQAEHVMIHSIIHEDTSLALGALFLPKHSTLFFIRTSKKK